MHRYVYQALPLLFAASLVGCSDAESNNANALRQNHPTPAQFNPDDTGAISGQVLWQGALPEVPELAMRTTPPVAPGQTCPHPNTPAIDPRSRGVGNAVVYLRGVDAARARAWDHPAVRAEMRDLKIHICQGDSDTRVGIVRRGDTVEMISKEGRFHALEVRGAAFFSLRFADPERPSTRPLNQNGLVELKSAAGYYWMRGYLFVDEHPYYCRTDSHGRFKLSQVPPGQYQLVCWLPNWNIVRQDRDPESSLVTRMTLAAPLEKTQAVGVSKGAECTADFQIATSEFAKK